MVAIGGLFLMCSLKSTREYLHEQVIKLSLNIFYSYTDMELADLFIWSM